MSGADQPIVSFLLPAETAGERALEATISSVAELTDPGWELFVLGRLPGSSVDLERDPRLRVVPSSASPASAANQALQDCAGTFLCLLDPGGTVPGDALTHVRQALADEPSADMLYTDEAVLDSVGETVSVTRKPAWSPERLRGYLYTGRLLAMRTSVAREVGGFRDGFDGAHEHDLALRMAEVASAVVHVPHVCHHRTGEPAATPQASWSAGLVGVQQHLARSGIPGKAHLGTLPGTYRISRELDSEVSVTVVIPTRGAKGLAWGENRRYVVDAVRSLVEHAGHERFEVVVVHARDTPRHVLGELDPWGDRVRIEGFAGPFRRPQMWNRGVMSSEGQVIVLLEDAVEVAAPGFVRELVAPLLESGVGLTGPRVQLSDGTLRDGGLALFQHEGEPMFVHEPDGETPALTVNRECSGLAGSCLALTRETFYAIGGLNEKLRIGYDIDLSLKVATLGLRRVWVASALLRHFALRTEDREPRRADLRLLRDRWALADVDPYEPDYGERQLRRAKRRERKRIQRIAHRTPLV